MKKLLAICLASSLTLSACLADRPAYALLEQPEYNHGKLYIYRPAAYLNAKNIYRIKADGKPIGTIGNDRYAGFDLPAGMHTITVQSGNIQTSAEVALRVNQIKCLKITLDKKKKTLLQPVPYEQCRVDIISTEQQN